MQATDRRRQYAKAAALAAAGVVAVAPLAPVTPWTSAKSAVQRAVQLVAGDSLLNVPLNLFYDSVNVPYYELEATDFFARSLFNSGPWFVVGPTNLWGVDPGDPSHFQSTVNFLVPNPVLSGMESNELAGLTAPDGEVVPGGGLGQMLWEIMAAALPTSSGCDTQTCTPLVPESPVTGITNVDFFLWLSKVMSGQEKFPLFDSWFKVGFDQLAKGFYFNPQLDAMTDPSGIAYSTPADGLFPNLQTIPGTQGTTDETSPTDPGDAPSPIPLQDGTILPTAPMPWSGYTFTMDPSQPFQNFFNSLMAPPPTDGLFGTGILLPTFEQIGRTLQSIIAGSMFFDPLTPGSPFCPGECTFVTDSNTDYPDLIKDINNLWPGNTLIENWVNNYDATPDYLGDNVPTEASIQQAIYLLQNIGFYDTDVTRVPNDWNLSGVNLDSLAPEFYKFWTDLGFKLPPLTDEHYPSDLGGIPITGDPGDVATAADMIPASDAVNPMADASVGAMSLLNLLTMGVM
ncbi:MAG TPA: hypothetical protein VFR17_10875 [Mycobacterium sp.]|nr:hypothetical protein [Mycobacterium sp.]